MDTLEKVRAALDEVRYSELVKLSEESGVPVGTLARIKYGQAKNPRFETVKKLASHFARLEEAAA